MKVRNTIILVIIALALGGYILFVEMRKDSTPDVDELDMSTRISNIELNDVVEFAVRDGHSSIRMLRQDESMTWVIDQAESVTADPDRIQRSLALVTRAKAERTLTGNEAGQLADFGLSSPTMDVTLKTSLNDEEWILLIGDQNPGKSLYYVMEKNGEAVYMIPISVVETVRSLISDPPYRPTPTPMASTVPARQSLIQEVVPVRLRNLT